MNCIRYKLHILKLCSLQALSYFLCPASSQTLDQHLSTLCAMKDSHRILDFRGAGSQVCGKVVAGTGRETQEWSEDVCSVLDMAT